MPKGLLFNVELGQLRDLLGRFRVANAQLLPIQVRRLSEGGGSLLSIVRREAPRKTGKFAEGHEVTVSGGPPATLKLGGPEPLASFIRFGTRPHPIVARNASALRFYWEGGPRGPGIYFYRSVNHPGTAPNPYITRSYTQWEPIGREILRKMAKDWRAEVQ